MTPVGDAMTQNDVNIRGVRIRFFLSALITMNDELSSERVTIIKRAITVVDERR